MQENRYKILKSSYFMSFATLLSRVLGLLRVMLEARTLGGGVIASAWNFAFMLPNLLRRLLGEGALGSALVPIINSHEVNYNTKTIRKELGVIFLVLSAILAVITIAVSLLAMAFGNYAKMEHIRLACTIIPLVMPYTIFMCLIGISSSVLTTRKVFFLPALGALLLNFFLIGGLFFCNYKGIKDYNQILKLLSTLVLISGFCQLILMLGLMIYYKIFPNFNFREIKKRLLLSELFRLALPSFIASSILQLGMFCDRLFALFIGAEALPSLNYSERIVYLPIGIFAVSISTVLLNDMSKSVVKKDFVELVDNFIFSLRQVMFFAVPLAVFIVFFREDIISSLFFYGKFNESNLKATSFAMLFYSLGIPFFCMLKVILQPFYAQKDTMTPLKVALGVFFLNMLLNFILMFPLKQGGLALATTISSATQCVLLLFIFQKRGFKVRYKELLNTFIKSLSCGLIASLIYFKVAKFVDLTQFDLTIRFLILSGYVIAFVIIYMLSMVIFKSKEVNEIFTLFKKKKNASQT